MKNLGKWKVGVWKLDERKMRILPSLSLLFSFLLFFFFFFFLSAFSNEVMSYTGLCCAKCGGNMPMNIPAGGVPETYEFRLMPMFSFMYMQGLRKGLNKISPQDVPQYEHLEDDMKMYMLMFSGGFSFTQRLYGEITFMWERRDMGMIMSGEGDHSSHHHTGDLQTSSGQNMTMTVMGIRDTTLTFKYLIWANDILVPTQQFTLLFGANLPTGSILEKDKTTGKLLSYDMQLGSGTLDPILGILYHGSSSPFWWGANIRGIFRPFKNQLGYSLGHQGMYDIFFMYQVRYNTVLEIQINGVHSFGIIGENKLLKEQNEKFPSPLFEAKNYGGHKVYLTPGIQFQPFQLQIISLEVSVPIIQYSSGYNMNEVLSLFVSYYFEIPTPASIRYTDRKQNELGF